MLTKKLFASMPHAILPLCYVGGEVSIEMELPKLLGCSDIILKHGIRPGAFSTLPIFWSGSDGPGRRQPVHPHLQMELPCAVRRSSANRCSGR